MNETICEECRAAPAVQVYRGVIGSLANTWARRYRPAVVPMEDEVGYEAAWPPQEQR